MPDAGVPAERNKLRAYKKYQCKDMHTSNTSANENNVTDNLKTN